MQLADVRPIKDQATRKIRNVWNILLDAYMLILLGAGGLVLSFLGYRFIGNSREIPSRLGNTLAIIWLGGGLTLTAIFYLFFNRVNPSFLSNARLRRIARRAIKKRPDRIVDPDEPVAKFIEILRRERWKSPSLSHASVVGFLKVDSTNGNLLFEGDTGRGRIPVQAILEAKQEYNVRYESFQTMGGGTGYTERRDFFVVLMVRYDEGVQETPIRILTGKGLFGTEKQGAATLELLHEINELQRACSSATES